MDLGWKKMKVCIAQSVSLSDHLALSTYLRSISKYLAKLKDIELILLPLKGTSIPNDIPNNIEIHEIKGSLYSIKGNIKYSYNLYKKLNEISKEKSIDLIHCLYPNSSVFGAVLFKRKFPNTKIIYDIRSPWVEMSIEKGSIPKFIIPVYRKLANQSERILAKYVDGFIFITEGLKKFYKNKKRLDSKPFDIIPSGVDLNLFSRKDPSVIRDKYDLKDDDLLVGYVGGISKMRELDFVLKAFKRLAKSDRSHKLMFVGDGDDKEHLEGLSNKLQIQDNVIFTSRVPYEQVPYYMSAFDLGLCHLPDKLVFRYSFPMKVLEYLGCGTPVLASDIEAHREIAKQLNCIFIYGNEDSFVRYIETLDNAIGDRNSLLSNLRSYSWPELCKKIQKFYYHLNS